VDIKLNFINNSNDANNSQVVIFGRNVATAFDELPVAWRVIQRCGQGDNHPFVYPVTMTVSAGDSYGNFTPQLPAEFGQQFAMTRTPSGDRLVQVGDSSNPDEVEVLNSLETGSIDAYIHKAGKVFATKTSIAPLQKAVFHFQPTIWIGAVGEVEEGATMNSAIVSNANTELSLFGIASADIVMTGGGAGIDARPFQFNFENVVMA
jgi:hypothetical protein